MNRNMRELELNELERSAIVFSPHPDDETLGCGGTILRKKQAGADIKIVFMTDGCQSHGHLIPANELKLIREKEAIAASHKLGLNRDDIIFLGFKDTALNKHQNLAIEKVAEIIQRFHPAEIFVPYHKESPSDHYATNRIVISAIKLCELSTVIYEYPIWFWCHWPWASLVGDRREILSVLKNSWLAGFGLNLVKDFRCAVFIGDVLEPKKVALEQHQSQMKPLIPDSGWMTLGDVSKGEFLECFFQNYEFFHRYNLAFEVSKPTKAASQA
jgi:LmbE family N-acetylglucosaminyl deacetylase